jgi:glycosyltransferase involved in cell wall biosynthesis
MSAVHHVGFIVEQALGHGTHARNLQGHLPDDPDIEAHWALIPWEVRGMAAHLPLYRSNWTVRAGLRARRAVAWLARQTPLDALFFHTQVPAVLSADWLRRIPSVVSLDATPLQYDALGEFYNHDPGPAWLERLKWRLNRDCFRAARHLVAWTHWSKAGLVADYQVPPEKVSVIPPGVDSAWWARPAPRPLVDGPVRILFVGGDLARKGGLDLLAAFRALRDSAPGPKGAGVELHLASRDSLPPEPGLFLYHDMQPNSEALRALYHDCDLFCLPTYGDCLPMVLSEAGAAGLPCVSTKVGGIAEIVRDGDTGFLTAPGDVAALTGALRRLVEDAALRRQMGARAVALVCQEFDTGANARRLLDLVRKVIELEEGAGGHG